MQIKKFVDEGRVPVVQPLQSTGTKKPRFSRFVDLFSGVGGFHLAARALDLECVFACDIDVDARAVYADNFGIEPAGDITSIAADSIPEHDLLFAGFPCQPFSIIGKRQGFTDDRGKLFFEIIRIVQHHRPPAIILENVKQLATSDRGRVIETIIFNLEKLGYFVQWKVLDARDFGLPQKRERVLLVASLESLENFRWPEKIPMTPLTDLLEKRPDPRHYVSARIRRDRETSHKAEFAPAIWHQNKGGNISSHPWSCALRAGASYNYLLVDGERRLTPREGFRLQGFPDSFKLSPSDAQARRQAGNAVPVPMVQSVMKALINAY